jgi:biotin transporter BioY
MYIIAIGWLWVAFMMAIAETSVVAGILTFVFYGMLPCGLIVYLMGTPARRRRQEASRERPGAGDAGTPAREDRERS